MMDPERYLDRIAGKKCRTPDITTWLGDPSEDEEKWPGLQRESACVYDYYASAALISHLLKTSGISYHAESQDWHIRAQNDLRNGSHLLSGPKVLHPLVFCEKIYLNLTNGIKLQSDWEKLKEYGIADEYPKPLSRENIETYVALKPLLLDYIHRILREVYGLFAYEQWGEGIAGVDGYREFLSVLYDEMAKNRCGLSSHYLSLWGALQAPVPIRIDGSDLRVSIADIVVDAVETVMSGYSQMTEDTMTLFTLAQPPRHEEPLVREDQPRRVRDDTFVLFQVSLREELGFAPQVDTLDDVLRVREDKAIVRFRQLFGALNRAIQMGDTEVLVEIRREIIRAKQALSRFGLTESRWFAWATGLLGFVPIVGQILSVTGILLHEVKALARKRNNWIYLGHRAP